MNLNNHKNWSTFIKDLRGVVSSAQESLPIDILFDNPEVFHEISQILSPFDITSWIMFDTEENRKSTENLLFQLWSLSSKKMFLQDEYLPSLFASFFSLYQVNSVRDEEYLVQNLVKKEHGFLVNKSKDFSLEEGDVFFGRILRSSKGNYIFQITDTLKKDQSSKLLMSFKEIFSIHSLSSLSMEDLSKNLARGNPELLFIYTLAKKMAFSETMKSQADGNYEDHWFNFNLDIEDLDPWMQFVYENLEEDMGARILLQMSCIKERYREENEGIEKGERIEDILLFASREGLIASDEDLSTLLFLWENFVNIQKDREKVDLKKDIMIYKKNLGFSSHGFYTDSFLRNSIGSIYHKNYWWDSFYDGFEKFIEYIYINDLESTPSGRFRYEDLDEITSICRLDAIRSLARPDERHYPILGMWKKFALIKGILEYQNGSFQITDTYEFYQQMDNEEKVALWIKSIVQESFLEEAFEKADFLFVKDGKDFYKNIQNLLIEAEKYPIEGRDMETEKDIFYLQLFSALKILVLVEEENEIYALSKLGKILLQYLNLAMEGEDRKVLTFPQEKVW